MKQGDIITLDFDSTKGHEQAGYRPAVVVSNAEFHKWSNLLLVCPIANTDRDFPMYVKLNDATRTTGVIMCNQIKAIDPAARTVKFVEVLPPMLMREVTDIIAASIEVL